MDPRRALVFAALLSIAALVGCEEDPGAGASPGHGRSLETVEQAIRPTDGTGWSGNGYGAVKVESYPTPGGHLKVWYATEGEHVVSPTDTDNNGVPDYVELVARHADAVWAELIDGLGLHAPLNDAVYHDRLDYGGDGRFDIYLQNLSQNDGYRVVEVCLETPFQCSGYLVMENDFKGFGYGSQDEAVKILTSHEFAHGILDAYDAGMPQFMSEGFATWASEAAFPEERDFEGFIGYYLSDPERPLDAERPGDFSDLFPYGAAIWLKFLEERHGVALVRGMLEALVDTAGTDPGLWEATDAVLQGAGSSLSEAFAEFALWNALTGSRAGLLSGAGYRDAALYPRVPVATTTWTSDGSDTLLAASFVLDRLSASYLVVPTAEQGTNTVTVTAYGRLRFVLVPMGIGAASAPVTLRPAGALDRGQLELPPAGQLMIIAVNPTPDRVSLNGELVVTGIAAPVEPVEAVEGEAEDTALVDAVTDVTDAWDAGAEPDPAGGDEGCGCRLGLGADPRSSAAVACLVLVGAVVARRRRRGR